MGKYRSDPAENGRVAPGFLRDVSYVEGAHVVVIDEASVERYLIDVNRLFEEVDHEWIRQAAESGAPRTAAPREMIVSPASGSSRV